MFKCIICKSKYTNRERMKYEIGNSAKEGICRYCGDDNYYCYTCTKDITGLKHYVCVECNAIFCKKCSKLHEHKIEVC